MSSCWLYPGEGYRSVTKWRRPWVRRWMCSSFASSHLGDARARDVAAQGQLNVGQLVRERHPDDGLVGFSTFPGTVTAVDDRGGRAERQSHYFRARLADQFDAVIYIDETRAVEPLERTARWDEGEVPETFPTAV